MKKMKLGLNSGNASSHLVDYCVFHLLSKHARITIYRAIIFPVVLYGCETWSLTLRGEHRLRVFDNGVLRKIFGPKRENLTGEWRRSHSEEINDLY
jgi:hypothetical protein